MPAILLLGTVLSQVQGGVVRVVAYICKPIASESGEELPCNKEEQLSVVIFQKKFWQYLYGCRVIRTDPCHRWVNWHGGWSWPQNMIV